MKKFTLLFIVLIGITCHTNAQNPQWINYTSGKDISAIAIENNVVWIGSYGGGLIKLDKSSGITTFYNSANSGLPGNKISATIIDNDGTKWIGTLSGGLASFDGTNWKVYNTGNSGLPKDHISTITFDKNGTKWIGTDNGLASFDGTNWKVYNTKNSGLPNGRIFAITMYPFGKLHSAGLVKNC